MRKILVISTLFLFINACDLIKSNAIKLTEREWYLFMKKNSSNRKTVFYTKENTPWSLNFNSDGTIDVTENGIKKIEKIHWDFSDNNKWLNINYNNKSGIWHYELSSKELYIVVFDNEDNNRNTIIRKYYHVDGDWKDENWVTDMNLMYKNTTE